MLCVSSFTQTADSGLWSKRYDSDLSVHILKTSLFYKMFFFPRDGMGHVVGGIYFGYWRWKTQNLMRSAGFVVCSWSFELVVVKTRPLYKYSIHGVYTLYTIGPCIGILYTGPIHCIGLACWDGAASCHYLRPHKHSAHSACYHAPQVKSVEHFGERTFGN